MHKAVKRGTTSFFEKSPELPRKGNNQGLSTGSNDEKLTNSNEREEDHALPGAGPVGRTVRNYRTVQQYSLPPKGPTGKKRFSDSTGSEQDYLLQGAGITEPAEATIRNYRNARSLPFLEGPAGKKKLGGYSTERGASEANLAEPIMRNQRNTRPASGITNRKIAIESTEKDHDGPSSDVQSDETTTPDPLPPGIPNREDPTVQDPLPPGPLLGPTGSQRKTQ